ncbi:hypothetical protein G7B40_015650 [Aetokthonos hydrillicola Thurmond2011]|uniref:Uncharacterized protein n=2 Tax=Aetokthonos TaxID=1550243 RepID=A0AAP5I6P2_9CYAN|nr:hypothetical protein [Aetokthonos hydrillicola]MDR9895987.1 hypothetical protein [Aetokthonos hydrillicola Thurmond2011]
MLTIYIIGVTYVFNQMVESIDDQIKVIFDKSKVDEQLKEQNLQDTVAISFSLLPSYSIENPKELSISVENKSDNKAIYVDWDNSAFEEFDGSSRRVIRKSPDLVRDLAVPQIASLVVPKKTLRESVTSESVLQRDNDSGTYVPKNAVANIIRWKTSPVRARRIEFGRFIDRKRDFDFSLDLVLRLADANTGIASGSEMPSLYIIKCPFTVKKLSWTYALPWNKRR